MQGKCGSDSEDLYQSYENSYQQCMEADIMSLLDHAAFEIRTVDEK